MQGLKGGLPLSSGAHRWNYRNGIDRGDYNYYNTRNHVLLSAANAAAANIGLPPPFPKIPKVESSMVVDGGGNKLPRFPCGYLAPTGVLQHGVQPGGLDAGTAASAAALSAASAATQVVEEEEEVVEVVEEEEESSRQLLQRAHSDGIDYEQLLMPEPTPAELFEAVGLPAQLAELLPQALQLGMAGQHHQPAPQPQREQWQQLAPARPSQHSQPPQQQQHELTMDDWSPATEAAAVAMPAEVDSRLAGSTPADLLPGNCQPCQQCPAAHASLLARLQCSAVLHMPACLPAVSCLPACSAVHCAAAPASVPACMPQNATSTLKYPVYWRSIHCRL